MSNGPDDKPQIVIMSTKTFTEMLAESNAAHQQVKRQRDELARFAMNHVVPLLDGSVPYTLRTRRYLIREARQLTKGIDLSPREDYQS